MAERHKIGQAVYTICRGLQALRRCRARILAYHSISDQRTDCWSVGRGQFERHMQFLRASGLTVVSLCELVRRIERRLSLEKLVAITFDDGYRDFLEHAVPILSDYEVPATIFVPVALLGGVSAWSQLVPSAPIMTIEQLARILQQGFTIGSHSMTHPRLSLLSNAVLLEEISSSGRWLREGLGLDWMPFAYPFGDFGKRERWVVEAVGYDCAVGFGGLWGNGHETNLFELNRDAIMRSCDDRAFQLLLSGWNDWLVAAHSLVHF